MVDEQLGAKAIMAGSYRELEVYRAAHVMGVELHRFSLSLPKYELYESGSQLRRALKAVSANIVEGYGRRRYKQDFIRFLVYGQSSCDETMEWLQYIKDCHPDQAEQAVRHIQSVDEIGKRLNRFIQSVERQHKT